MTTASRAAQGLLLSLTLALSACGQNSSVPAAPPAPPLPTALDYSCLGGGGTVRAAYVGTGAIVTFGGETWNMTRTSDPGRFTAQGRQWQVRALPDHEEGVLSVTGAKSTAITRCQRTGPKSTAALALATPGGPPACGAGDLSLKFLTEDAGAGQRHDVFAVKNRGLAACVVQGFATVALLGADGKPVRGVKVVSSLTAGPVSGPAAKLSLAPGARAVFYLHHTAIPFGDDETCPQVSRVQITLPGGKSGLIPLEAQPCGGRVEISPLRKDPGTDDGM